MSLRVFHIIFIVISTLTTLGFGIWGLQQQSVNALYGVWGVISLAISLGLIVYGFTFFKKLKKLDQQNHS